MHHHWRIQYDKGSRSDHTNITNSEVGRTSLFTKPTCELAGKQVRAAPKKTKSKRRVSSGEASASDKRHKISGPTLHKEEKCTSVLHYNLNGVVGIVVFTQQTRQQYLFKFYNTTKFSCTNVQSQILY